MLKRKKSKNAVVCPHSLMRLSRDVSFLLTIFSISHNKLSPSSIEQDNSKHFSECVVGCHYVVVREYVEGGVHMCIAQEKG